ncbi:xanthine dehydrogenase family protein molybdopterin-binding subunit [Sulfobacillus sp. DSM 109850]|uniref:Xanthine dehydrogenase family protein molybdopterin-binding subunit n=1 Tax=Sulfobacillus harzensis TaxID=2729629 RepID=A0A7Y0Q150_9FIRM|nr:xanthine dehydrogenase family protein molybdopterin-binding subunit [Sulfobacillus harzensis]
MPKERWVGRPVPRVEDRALIQGQGQYVSDIHFEGQWAMALVRSPHAHAIIRSIDIKAAEKAPGVRAVITAEQFPELQRPLPGMAPIAPPPLAYEKVFYVGQPVAVILAEDRYLAEDAVELVSVQYEPLDALTQVEEAAKDHVVLHPELGSNILDHVHYESGDSLQALEKADHIIRATLRLGRVSAQPMEPRAVAAHYDAVRGQLLVYDATQSVHRAQERIAEFLQMPPDHIRVVAPEVGGGFGVKNGTYSEEALVVWSAVHFNNPVKWAGDRFEEFLGTYQEREQVHEVALGINQDGTLVALVDTYYQDNGAYPGGGMIVARTTARNLPGPYRIPNLFIDGRTVLTNKVPQAPYRGAGRPQGHYIIERMLDRAADTLGLDRIAIRMKNLIRPNDLPYAIGIPDVVYDSGDFPGAFHDLLEIVDVEAFRQRQQEARQQGIRLGLGIANYVEVSAGFGFEGVKMELLPGGRIRLSTGATGQGQGHRTALAQIAADTLGLAIDQVEVVEGDTGGIAKGIGTFGSRTIIMAGNATKKAGDGLIAKAKEAAARILEAHADDLTFAEGQFHVEGVPSVALGWSQIAERLQELGEPPLTHEDMFGSNTPTYGFGSHALIVRVDEKTADIKIERYVIVHDGGAIVNPLLANGQVIGGTVQGLGSALYEEMIYNEDGQPLTTSFLDYRLPGAKESPDIEIHHRDYPAPSNPSGYKGVGEAGIIPSQAIALSAVEDAFHDLGLRLDYAPITPGRLYQALAALQGGHAE